MKTKYPYRFKTKQEFEKEFGEDWRLHANFNTDGQMDYLCGTEYPYVVPDGSLYLPGFQMWGVRWKMLIKNTPTVPNYNPRKITREI